MDEFTILWLDSNSSDPMSGFRSKLGDAQTFTDADKCIQYIRSHPNQFIYLIISEAFAQKVVPEVYDYSNVIQIYLFCGSVAAYSDWGVNYCDKMLMYEHGDDLLARLWKELEMKLNEQANLCLKQADEYKQKALAYKQPSCG